VRAPGPPSGYDHLMRWFVILLSVLVSPLTVGAQTRQRPVKPAPKPAPAKPAPLFKTTMSLDDMRGKQAVVETAHGTFVIHLMPEAAPNHVGYFLAEAAKGAYDKTTFHRAVPMGIVQGGDPLSKDPAKRAMYGTGGLGMLAAEFNKEPMTRGAVAAVLQPGKPDSAGNQFFIAVTDQVALNGQFTVFGRVVEGLEVVQAISRTPVDADGKATERVEITKVTIRDMPPVDHVPFATESPEELASYRAVIETPRGMIRLTFDPVKAPIHVRNFLRLASAGVYDGTTFHRVVRGFVIQGGMVFTRPTPLTQKQQDYVTTLPPEFNDTPHLPGILSMARTDDPASASTSFFICTGAAPSLDGKYSVFGRVVSGMEVVRAIEADPVAGEDPVQPVTITRVRVERLP
jgi:peptidyl-prolyl cis-trans isomerase B (cyclophilin B)